MTISSDAAVQLQSDFRAAMACVCTPVSVVTTIEDGHPHGTTVSAFASQSMTPPMLIVSLSAESDLLAMVRRTGRFGLNVLAAHQSELALRFAVKGTTKFAGAAWTADAGAARLAEVAVWAACVVRDVVVGGDHSVLLGEVMSAETAAVDPLTYHSREFGTHRRHSEVA
jgi:flavin reductase (DIM6/NTAB) family NADH-FMN oxidoreductase RutF